MHAQGIPIVKRYYINTPLTFTAFLTGYRPLKKDEFNKNWLLSKRRQENPPDAFADILPFSAPAGEKISASP